MSLLIVVVRPIKFEFLWGKPIHKTAEIYTQLAIKTFRKRTKSVRL
jgi:hypothetical protein